MNVLLYLKPHSAPAYEFRGSREFEELPRTDDFISVGEGESRKFFQVVAVHFPETGNTELYAIHAEPSWEYKRSGNIGFSFT